MSIKRKLTEVAVDSFTEYLEERLAKLKELDLDQDGQKDVDQIITILKKCAVSVKGVLDTTDLTKMAAGMDQMIAGANMIGTSFDREKLKTVGGDLREGLTTLSHLAQLGLVELKEREPRQLDQ